MFRTVAIPTVITAMVMFHGGCESVPGDSRQPGEWKVVELLDAYFVRFEKERIPIDEFLFQMRQLGRAASFGIRIVAPKDISREQRQALDRIISDLQVSGIRHVKMG